jgi:EmrB/QacA subfamily drug resistance transporter
VNQQEPPRPARSARPARQEVWTLTLTSAALFMSGLDNLVVITALPTIRTHFHATLPQLEWTVNAYTLTFAVLLLTGAALGDRFGRRRVLICGIATFTAGSLAAALATTSAALIAARALQGCGAAALLPLTLTVLTEAIPAQRRAVALGVWSGVNGLAVALGPVIGGFIIVHATWQWIFLVNVPVGLALLPLIRLRLAESHGPNDRLDLTGTALVSAALLGIVYALVSGNQDGWGSPRVLGPALGGAFLLGAFSGWETRTRAPMVPLRLYRSRTFSIANAVSLLAFLGIFGSIFLLTQYLQGIEDYSPYAAGIRTLPWTAMPILVAPLGGLIAARIGAKPVVTSGLTCMTGGLAWFAAAIHLHTPYTAMITPMALCGIGMSLYFAPLAHLVMGAVRAPDQGMASGISNAVRELGGVLGIAILTAVFTANGSLATASDFTRGLTPALWTGTAALATAALLMLLAPTSPIHRTPKATPGHAPEHSDHAR